MTPGLLPIEPHRRDFSLLHSFASHPEYGAVVADPSILPLNFSIYGSQPIPNQNDVDTRFAPPLPPLPYGCTGETGAFESGLQDGELYNPKALYDATPPHDSGGRDIRAMLQTLIDVGPQSADGNMGPKRTQYFNCYGSGKIDDFDAARIALWVNQWEKRGVYVGSWWYGLAWVKDAIKSGSLPPPSFVTKEGTLHCYLVAGWRTLENGTVELEVLSWQGMDYGNAGVVWMSRDIYNKLMAQPFTGAFTVTKNAAQAIPVGLKAYYDHVAYVLGQFIRNLFGA